MDSEEGGADAADRAMCFNEDTSSQLRPTFALHLCRLTDSVSFAFPPCPLSMYMCVCSLMNIVCSLENMLLADHLVSFPAVRSSPGAGRALPALGDESS